MYVWASQWAHQPKIGIHIFLAYIYRLKCLIVKSVYNSNRGYYKWNCNWMRIYQTAHSTKGWWVTIFLPVVYELTGMNSLWNHYSTSLKEMLGSFHWDSQPLLHLGKHWIWTWSNLNVNIFIVVQRIYCIVFCASIRSANWPEGGFSGYYDCK